MGGGIPPKFPPEEYPLTFLNSTTRLDDKDLAIDGYNLFQADHPKKVKEGGLCIYYKESLAVLQIEINFLSECVLCKVTLGNKKGYISVSYRSPSQKSHEFEEFLRF